MTGAGASGAEVTVTGVVSVERVAVGSKSERDAVVLSDSGTGWLLRRAGASTFDLDPEFARLAGSTVTVTGTTGSGVLVVVSLHAHTVAPSNDAGSDGDGDRGDVR